MNKEDLYRKFTKLVELNRKGNIRLAATFLSAIIIILLGVIGNPDPKESTYNSQVLSLMVSVLSLVISALSLMAPLFLPGLDARRTKKMEAARRKEKEKEEKEYRAKVQKRTRIFRKAQLLDLWDAMQGDERFIFLYGDSGCGKTTLLDEFRERMKKHEKKCAHKWARYNESWADKLAGSDKSVVILDQFELALQNRRELEDFLSKCRDGREVKVIFSFKSEAFGPLVSIFCTCGIPINAILPMPLTYTKADQDALRKKTLNCFQKNESISREEIRTARGSSEMAALLDDITERIYNDRILLIEWSLVMDAVCRLSPKKISYIYREETDFNQLMSRLMLSTLKQFSYPEIALPILYLLSRNLNEAYSITLSDFQLATFRSKDAVTATLTELKEVGWIRAVLGDPEMPSSGTEYEISHEYIGKKFATICNAQLDAEILKNLNNYEFSSRHGGWEDSSNSVGQKLYEDYQSGRNSPRLGVMLHILLVIVAASAVVRRLPTLLAPEWTPNWDLFHSPPSMSHVGVLIVCGLSTFYVYNFSYFILCPYRVRAFVVDIFGSIMVTLCLICPKYWPVFLALETIIVGAILIWCFKKARKSSGKITQMPGFFFILCGGAILLFGLAFLQWNKTSSLVPFLAFIFFISSAIKLHINYDFVYQILGKLL